MGDYPRDQLQFEEQFATEEACRQYLARLRWPEGFRCTDCGCRHAWRTRRALLFCTGCGKQVSLTAGTIFAGTRKPLKLWFRAVWYVVGQKNGVSALGLQRILGLSRYETTWIWLHKLRRAMVRPGRERLQGAVEVDETYVGGSHAGKTGRGAEGKTLVLILAENKCDELGRIRLYRVATAGAADLLPAIEQNVEPGSTVCTDGWSGYQNLPEHDYDHVVVRPRAQVGEDLLPLAHLVASHLKRWLVGTHQAAVRPSHLDYYLDEFTFRFNRRTSRSRGKLFYRLLQQAVAVSPVPAGTIRGGSSSTPSRIQDVGVLN
jgi:transposase-like protein